MVRPLVCVAGKGRIAVDALTELVRRGWADRLVICANRTDTGVSDWQPSLRRFAQAWSIPTRTPAELYGEAEMVFLSLEFDTLIRPTRFASHRLYNIHFSRLPAYKGMYTSTWPILRGERTVGVTLHAIDAGIDTGPIVDREAFPLSAEWTARDLYLAYHARGTTLLRRNLDRLLDEREPASSPQPAEGSSYFAKSSIAFDDHEIDWNDTAWGLTRQLRAFSFREYQVPRLGSFAIGGWRVLPNRSSARSGTVVSSDQERTVVATVDFDLELHRFGDWDWLDVSADMEPSLVDQLPPAKIDIADAHGRTALMRAIRAGDAALCRLLLERHADPNRGDQDGTRPLMVARALEGAGRACAIEEELLRHGADEALPDHFSLEHRTV